MFYGLTRRAAVVARGRRWAGGGPGGRVEEPRAAVRAGGGGARSWGGQWGGVSGDQCWPVGGPLSNPKVGDLDLIKSGGVALMVVHRDQSYWALDRSIRVLGVSSCLC